MKIRFKILVRTIFIFALLIVPMYATSGDNRWTTSGPYGGQVSAFAFHPRVPSIIFTINGGLFKSTTTGTTWQHIKVPFFGMIAIHFSPRSPYRLFVASSQSLFVTPDLGVRWQRMGDFPGNVEVKDFAFHSNSNSILYLLLGNGSFYRSTDEGRTWQSRTTGLPQSGYFTSMVVDQKNGEIVYLTVDRSIFKTENGGVTWTRVATLDGYGAYLFSLAIHPKNRSVLYAGFGTGGGSVLASTDAGRSWQIINYNYGVSSLAIDPRTPNVVYAAGTGLQASSDDGKSWQALQPPPRYLTNYLTIAVHPLLSSFVFIGDGGNGVFRSKDGGINWTTVNKGMSALSIQPIASAGPGNLLASGYNWQIYQKNSEKAPWNILQALMTKRVEQIAVHPRNPKLIAVAGDFRNPNGPFGPNIAVSTDGGDSWRVSEAFGGPSSYERVLAFHSQNPNILFMAVLNNDGALAGVARSINQGKTWKLSNAGITNHRVVKLSVGFEPESPIYAISERDPEIYRSENAGDSWERIVMPLHDEHPADVAASYKGVYIATIMSDLSSNIYFSSDGGRTLIKKHHFSSEGTLPITHVAVDPLKPSTIFAYNSVGRSLYKSTDKGQTWSRFPRPPLTINDMIVDFYDHNTYHLATGGGVYSYTQK